MSMKCFKCDKELACIHEDHDIFIQPMSGLAFQTKGHYGSAYFDPMDGSYIELCICDKCLEDADNDQTRMIKFDPKGKRIT